MRPEHIDKQIFQDSLNLFHSRNGELNLFVIRHIATQHKGGVEMLLAELAKHYTIIAIKNVSWRFRWFKAHTIRGGKWKRGGKPALAVIVFDPQPIDITSEADASETHPFVFNARQFFKPKLRAAFAEKFSVKPKLNPLHSADNEYEALEHMQHLFSQKEMAQIEALCKQEREAL